MITESTFKFLRGLKANNNKEWFDKNRKLYESSKNEFENFILAMIPEIEKIDKKVQYLTPKDCVFRIYRDVRFSTDKTPYKPNFGAHIVRDGKKSGYAGYYIHLESGGSFLGGGVYGPEPNILKALRTEIFENIEDFKKLTNNKDFKKYFNEVWGDKLKVLPKGFPKDFPDAELLKFKDYCVVRNLTDKEVLSGDYIEEIKKTFKAMLPFNNFVNRAIDYMKEGN